MWYRLELPIQLESDFTRLYAREQLLKAPEEVVVLLFEHRAARTGLLCPMRVQDPQRKNGKPINDGRGGFGVQRCTLIQIGAIKQGQVDVLDGCVPPSVEVVDTTFPACDLVVACLLYTSRCV